MSPVLSPSADSGPSKVLPAHPGLRGHSPPAPRAQVFVALGGNEGDVPATFVRAIALLAEQSILTVAAVSRLYESAALVRPGAAAQANYCNAVLRGETCLPACEFVERVHALAFALGRAQASPSGAKWQPRPLDLDVLAYGSEVISEPHCQLPHRGLPFRPFVLWPLAEVAGPWHVQPLNLTPAALLRRLVRPQQGLLRTSLSWRAILWSPVS